MKLSRLVTLTATLIVCLSSVQGFAADGTSEGGALRVLSRNQAVKQHSPETRTAGLFSPGLRLPMPRQWQTPRYGSNVGGGIPTRYQTGGNCPNGNCNRVNGNGYPESGRNLNGQFGNRSADSDWTPRRSDTYAASRNDRRRDFERDRDFDRDMDRDLDRDADRLNDRGDYRGRSLLWTNSSTDRFTDRRDLNRLSGTSYFPTSRDDAGYLRDIPNNSCPNGQCGPQGIARGGCVNGQCSQITGYRGDYSDRGDCSNGQCGTGSCPNGRCGTASPVGYNNSWNGPMNRGRTIYRSTPSRR
jgi:hypothetical protein